MENSHVVALKRAVEIAGSQRELARRIREFGTARKLEKLSRCSQQTVSYWINNEVLLEPEWWPAFEHATENSVTRAQLRPDVSFAAVA